MKAIICMLLYTVTRHTVAEKPGWCPPIIRARTCTEGCSSDYDCYGSKKCCSHSCGHTCQNPVGLVQAEKPGYCPKVTGFGDCVDVCSSDHDCGGSQKCCSDGCGHICQDAFNQSLVQKSRSCPNFSGFMCVEACSSDQDCASDHKCCSSGCGHMCQIPVDSGLTCTYHGVTYNNEDRFNSTDRCNKCNCSNGMVVCTKIACLNIVG